MTGLLTENSTQITPPRLAVRLFAWRSGYGFGALESVILALYTAILALVIPFHEHWADESQAWVLSRDNTFFQILRYRMHYEGTPPDWHILLRLLQFAHVPWSAFGAIGGIIAIAGIYVLVRWSPFPLLLRALLPFTFFLLYQYAVVTRSYVLFPVLLFCLCTTYTARRPRPLLFAVIAVLLANLCLQGAIVASITTVLYALKLYRNRATRSALLPLAPSCIMLAFGAIVCVYTAMPAPDVAFAVRDQVATGPAHRLLVKLLGETPRTVSLDHADLTALIPAPVYATGPAPAFNASPRNWLTWQLTAPPGANTLGPTATGILDTLVELISEAVWPIATSSLLAAAFILTLLAWTYTRRGLLNLLPSLILWLTGEFLWVTDHHAGMLLLSLLAAVWITSRESAIPDTPSHLTLDRTFIAFTALIFALQIGWSIHTIQQDRRQPYDPGAATAHFLLSSHPHARIAGFHFWTESIQPFYPANPFFNLPAGFWQWSTNVTPDADHRSVIASHPELVVYTVEDPLPDAMRNQIATLNPPPNHAADPILADLVTHGYRETHRFCGDRFSRLAASFRVCDIIFEPATFEPR